MEVEKLPTLPTLMKKKQVAAYARVSTGKDAMLHSLSAQVSYYSAYIQKQPEWLYCGVYVDEAVTGTKSRSDRNSSGCCPTVVPGRSTWSSLKRLWDISPALKQEIFTCVDEAHDVYNLALASGEIEGVIGQDQRFCRLDFG